MLLLFLDDYHLGDPLFVGRLAQLMGRRAGRPPCLVVHGGGEAAERALEAQGLVPGRRGGVVVAETAEQAALAERAVRRLNQKIVGTLTDEGVPAVGLQAADRGLLRRAEGGAVEAGRTAWLQALVRQGAVPVVSPLVGGAGGVLREVPAAAVAEALARSFGAEPPTLVFFTRHDRPGLPGRAAAPLAEVPPESLAAPAAVKSALESGLTAWLTSPAGLFGADEPLRTRLVEA